MERYHEWMKDPKMLELTGSEPLSLAEEIAMQKSWRDDNDKCTFIVLAKERCTFLPDGHQEDPAFVDRNLSAMVGDVNLFFSDEDEDEDEEDGIESSNQGQETKLGGSHKQAEIDIMIAESDHRGQGLGREATCLMLLYGASNVGFRRAFCKINQDNHASRNLFEKKLGFIECAYAECFQQYELELKRPTTDDLVDCLKDLVPKYSTFRCSLLDSET